MKRPVVSNYENIAEFVRDMLVYLKSNKEGYSVLKATRGLRRVSPALVTLVATGKRKLTVDRCDEFSQLLDLTFQEKVYLRDSLVRTEGRNELVPRSTAQISENESGQPRRKSAQIGLLSDWLNVYVKDAFQIKRVKRNPSLIYSVLAGIASQKRIDKCIRFLVSHGYLRKTIRGEYIEDTPLHSVDHKVPHQKVRAFHKASLSISASALDQFPASERFANALILPLTEKRYVELTELISKMSQELQSFAESSKDGDALYQVIIHLSPTGGKNVKA